MKPAIYSVALALVLTCAAQGAECACGGASAAFRPVVLQAQTTPAASPFAVYAARRASATPIALASSPAAPVVAQSPVIAAPAPVAAPAPCCPPAAGTVVTYRPIVAAPAPGVVLGEGLFGQPKAYVTGQPVRNFLRYLTP